MPKKSAAAVKEKETNLSFGSFSTANRKDRKFVTALGRGIEILQCFTPSEPELGTAEIASMVKLPQPTVWRLCYTLACKGLLTFSPHNKKLRLGVPVLGLGYAVIANHQIAEIARPYMQAIADGYRGAVTLGAPDGLSMIYLQRCEGSSIVLVNHQVGSRVPVAYSAMGWSYLATLEPDQLESVLTQIQATEGSQWRQIERRLKSALTAFAKNGYILNKGSLHRQINGVGVPVKFQDTDALLCLSASGINSLFTDDRLHKLGESLLELASTLRNVPPRQRMSSHPSPL